MREGGGCLEELSIKFPQGYITLEAVVAPRYNFRAGIWAGLPPLEAVAAPHADFFTEIGQVFRL